LAVTSGGMRQQPAVGGGWRRLAAAGADGVSPAKAGVGGEGGGRRRRRGRRTAATAAVPGHPTHPRYAFEPFDIHSFFVRGLLYTHVQTGS